ncbi:MAG TPA: heavy-metal-associated domain-containing protein [Bacteroidota bacterium]|nr:heavy-metal-associated domain-containing protein [Bacteroidota bacterium]
MNDLMTDRQKHQQAGHSATMLASAVSTLAVLIFIFTFSLSVAGDKTKTVRFKVEGMTCDGCAKNIGAALSKVDGVGKTDINVREGWADVEFVAASVTPGEIVRSIVGAGYHASPMSEGEDPAQQKSESGSSNPKLDEIRSGLSKIKDGMMMDGRYACCIAPSCDLCAMAENGCECGNNLAKGKPVCPECKGGWTAGFGTMPDIDPKDVKVMPDDQVKKMYQNRAELIKNSRKAVKKN